MIPIFLNPWMLIGLGLIAIPIAIHLFNKSRFNIEPWGAMMFLKKAIEVRAQRIKLEQILLLILRSLLLVLFVLALSRPISNFGGGSPTDPTTHVIILDGSYSMHQGVGQNNTFTRARRSALQVVDRMHDGDSMLVILAGTRPRLLFPRPSFDKKFLRDKLLLTETGKDQTMDLPKALEHAYWLLEQSSLPRHRIYVLTDGQEHGWRSKQKGRWERVARHADLQKVTPSLYVVEHQPSDTMRNTAVVKVTPRTPIVDIFRPTKFLVELANYGGDNETIHVEFFVDGELCGEKDAACTPGLTTVEFDHAFTPIENDNKWKTDGPRSWHYITVEIEEDDIDEDNTFALALEVQHAIPILIVEGTDAEDTFDSEGGLLELALQSANDPGKQGLFEVTRRKLFELPDEIQKLDNYKTIILANIPSLSRDFQFALEQFIEQGGGLLVTLGDQVEANRYNLMSNNGQGVIPATLKKIRTCGERPFLPSFPAGTGTHVLNIFDTTRTRILTEVRVEKFWACKPAEDAVTLAMFGDLPFLIYRHYGEGRVALWTTSANMKWTTFPVKQDYLPLLQNLVTYLSASIRPPINLAQGEMLIYGLRKPPASDVKDADLCTIIGPDQIRHKVVGQHVAGKWVVEWENTMQPGIYTVQAGLAPPKYYAVALKPGEGDLSELPRAARNRLTQSVVNDFVSSTEQLKEAIITEEGASEWWRKLVFVALFLLCGELYVGWRFNG